MSVDSLTSTSSTSSTAAATGSNALSSISSNYNDFLKLLTTQLQNQDPSNPMDTSQFTSELAQFAGVEQQISTNTNLTSLIQLAQGQEVLQGSSLLGKQVDLNSTTLPLQGSAAHLDFTSSTAQNVTVTVTDASGAVVDQQAVTASAGSNGWDWDGKNSSGVAQADGAYTASVVAASGSGGSTALDFTTRGTVTGVTKDGSSIDLSLGSATIDLGKVVKIDS